MGTTKMTSVPQPDSSVQQQQQQQNHTTGISLQLIYRKVHLMPHRQPRGSLIPEIPTTTTGLDWSLENPNESSPRVDKPGVLVSSKDTCSKTWSRITVRNQKHLKVTYVRLKGEHVRREMYM